MTIKPRLEVRLAVTLGSGGQLDLTVRTRRGELLEYLPAQFDQDGVLSLGTLVLVDDARGRHRLSYTGNHEWDYVHLGPAARYIGFEPAEPMMPLDALASAEPGLVTIERVAPDRWTPRAWAGDPRVERVDEMLKSGTPWERVVAKLIPQDRKALDDLALGQRQVHQVPPHVARLYSARPCVVG